MNKKALIQQAKSKEVMEESGKRLRNNLQERISKGSDGSLFGDISLSFSKNLLNDLNNRKVIKKCQK